MGSSSPRKIPTLPELPSGWSYHELGDLLEGNELSYGIVQPGANDVTGVPIVRVNNLRNGQVGTEDVLRVRSEIEGKYLRTRLRGGEVLLSLVGSVGQVGVVPERLAGWNVARAIAVIRPSGKVSALWLKYCLSSELVQRHMRMWQTDTVQATLNLRDVRRLPVVMPRKSERDAITSVLAALDAKIDLDARISRIAQALAGAVWSATSRRGAVEAVTETTLGHLADEGVLYFTDGYRTKQSELGKPGVPVLRVADVADGRFVPSRKDCVLEELRVKFAHKISQPGDVVLTTKGTIGRIAMIPAAMSEFVYSPQLCFFRVQPGAPLDRHWLYGWFRGPEFRERAAAVQHQTDMAPYINLVDLRETRITLPPPDVQRRTGDLIAPLEETAQAALYESEVLASLRDTLLPGLLSGELRVRDVEELAEEAM
jgi:type I restriction enzyme S subunit